MSTRRLIHSLSVNRPMITSSSTPPTRSLPDHYRTLGLQLTPQQTSFHTSTLRSARTQTTTSSDAPRNNKPVISKDSSSDNPNHPTLTWPEYLSLRKQQRRYALSATVPTTTIGLGLGIHHFATIEAAATDLIMGIEAPYVYGLATLGCGMFGYLIGPTIGHVLFRLLRVSKPTQLAMQDKNSEFYSHIKKNRVDPAQSIVNHPLPDWHGERVGSFKDYRAWLRDQSAYRRKATQHGILLRPQDFNHGKDLL